MSSPELLVTMKGQTFKGEEVEEKGSREGMVRWWQGRDNGREGREIAVKSFELKSGPLHCSLSCRPCYIYFFVVISQANS